MRDSVYVYLFHGRKDPNQEMDDWGERGPILGPFHFVHTTYGSDIKLGDPRGRNHGETIGELTIFNDLVYYDGMFYGDWSVMSSATAHKDIVLDKSSIQEFDSEKAKLSEKFKPKIEVLIDRNDLGKVLDSLQVRQEEYENFDYNDSDLTPNDNDLTQIIDDLRGYLS